MNDGDEAFLLAIPDAPGPAWLRRSGDLMLRSFRGCFAAIGRARRQNFGAFGGARGVVAAVTGHARPVDGRAGDDSRAR